MQLFLLWSNFFVSFLKNKIYLYLKSTTWWFDIYMHTKMITTVKLINIPSPHVVTILCLWLEHLKCRRLYGIYIYIYIFFNTTLLMIVITEYIRSLGIFFLPNCNFVLFDLVFPHFPHLLTLDKHHSTLCFNVFYVFRFYMRWCIFFSSCIYLH